jgi:hypothetical protein
METFLRIVRSLRPGVLLKAREGHECHFQEQKSKADELRLASALKLVRSLHSVEQGELRNSP